MLSSIYKLDNKNLQKGNEKMEKLSKRQMDKAQKEALELNSRATDMVEYEEAENVQKAIDILVCLEEIENSRSLSEKAKRVAMNVMAASCEVILAASAATVSYEIVGKLLDGTYNPSTDMGQPSPVIPGMVLAGVAMLECMRRSYNRSNEELDLETAKEISQDS